ncbi:phage head-tail adapter protein [Mammaliicoccus sciuri]|uniref:phage head-tail adapter protein n=1 Tax=Mammaliicoccus sciuri TaxID=1296 RepID=UPI00288359BE|nr:phage head-tail adapter protein [Mammaliicoccus sciuri]MDT0711078.1 phage head-tail adapter protein [Mammaliicoccus sciuri]
MFNPYDEYPHTVELGFIEEVGDIRYTQKLFKSEKTIKAFMDTPTTSETLKFHQMHLDVDINMYTPYLTKFNPKKAHFRYNGKVYQCVGDLENQGGMNEVHKTHLKATPYG